VKLNLKKHPEGTRFIALTSSWTSDEDRPFEATVLEWSPKGRVKLQYESGNKTWLDANSRDRLVVVEVLPAKQEAKV